MFKVLVCQVICLSVWMYVRALALYILFNASKLTSTIKVCYIMLFIENGVNRTSVLCTMKNKRILFHYCLWVIFFFKLNFASAFTRYFVYIFHYGWKCINSVFSNALRFFFSFCFYIKFV